jgi:uncharacterized membrane protein
VWVKKGRNAMIDSLILWFYQLLDILGFSDPIHAAIVHMPIGLVVGAFIFGWTAVFVGNEVMARSAHYCIVLAMILAVPAVIFVLTDWRHYYGGVWITPIKIKMILTIILFALLMTAIYLGTRQETIYKKIVPGVYAVCLINVVFLGWFGARLIYGEDPKNALMPYRSGYQTYEFFCGACHPNGGNTVTPSITVTNSPKLKDMDSFISYIRHSEGTGSMPSFSPSQLPDHQAEELYLYITVVLQGKGATTGRP